MSEPKIINTPEELIETFGTLHGLGLDQAVIASLTYDAISEIASYQGFPVRYSNWGEFFKDKPIQKKSKIRSIDDEWQS